MPSKPFDKKLYESFYQTQIELGVTEDLARKAAQILASDDPHKPSLGRSPEDQEIIKQVHAQFLEQWEKK